jgi:hypothetical protein
LTYLLDFDWLNHENFFIARRWFFAPVAAISTISTITALLVLADFATDFAINFAVRCQQRGAGR